MPAIRTDYSVYCARETEAGTMAAAGYRRIRRSDFGLEGATEEITSDVILPDSRIKSSGDAGGESSSGPLATEFYIDETDAFLKAVMLDDDDEFPAKLGKVQQYFTFIKSYYQGTEPAYQVFTGVQVGQMQADFQMKSKVKLTFELKGMDNPVILLEGDEGYSKVKEIVQGATDYTDDNGKATSSYNTMKGGISLVAGNGEFSGDYSDLVRSFSFTLNQNPDATNSLFQMKAIDNSLGEEQLTGTIEVWNPQNNRSVRLRNAAKNWVKDVSIEIHLKKNLKGKVGDTEYTLKFNVSLKTPTESKDGNKLAFSIPVEVYDSDGLVVEKTVRDEAE